MLTIQIPFFPGFYESILSEALDYAVEQESECLVEQESCWPEPIRLNHSELWQAVDHRAAYERMAADWCSALDDWLSETIETKPGSFTYSHTDSPHYYNFETDHVYMNASVAIIKRLYAACDKARLSECIKARHTSRDGFISFYSNSLSEWEEKPVSEWDCIQLGTLLCAAIPETPDKWELCEGILERDHEYLDGNVDWEKHESDCESERAEKLARWIESDMSAAWKATQECERIAALVPLAMEELSDETRDEWQLIADNMPYRCPYILELPL